MFDHATAIGEVITASPSYYRVGAEFHGRAAHAGIRPEEGRSAILALALAVAAMPQGRIDPETTANVGSVSGGVGSTNVVAERARLLAEARSLDPEKAETTVSRMIDAINDAAASAECDVDITMHRLFAGYRQKPSAPAVTVAEAALRACGYEPRRIATGGGSDANALELSGFPCVNLANGTERNHEPTERVSVAALEGMLDVALALLDEAAALPDPDPSRRPRPPHELPLRTHRHGDRLRGPVLQRPPRGLPPRGRRGRHPRDRRPHGRGRDRRARRRASSGSCASRARPSARPTCWRSPPASSTRRGRSRWRPRSASWRRRSASRPPSWEPLGSFLHLAGFTNERVHLFLATGISDVDERPEVHEDERIHVEVRPLSELEALIESAEDAKTIIALARLRARLAAG